MQLRSCLLALAVTAGLSLAATHASAEQTWKVRSGQTTIHFNVDRMEDLGIGLSRVVETAQVEPGAINMEAPHWHFALSGNTDLTFNTERGLFTPGGFVDGALRHTGAFSLVVTETAQRRDVTDFDFTYNPVTAESPYVEALGLFDVTDTGGLTPLVTDMRGAKVRFLRDENRVEMGYIDLYVSSAWANSIGRPDLADQYIGYAGVDAHVDLVAGPDHDGDPLPPNFAGGTFRDVKLGILSSISAVSRTGTFPNGTNGLSMSTTSCNDGDVDVEWHAAMQEDHPSIAMQLYRYLDGKLEMVGHSDMKHGFFALSSSQCTACQNPSDGTFLGVGCSDTYGVSNNSDRYWLAPREEWDPFAGTWECNASHFANYQSNCSRNHGSGGHSANEHRVVVHDADLDLPGATYLYEAYYIVRDDEDKPDNVGSRFCNMSWSGASWNFNTSGGSNPLVEGPTILRWAEIAGIDPADVKTTWAQVAPGDGQVILACTVTDLGGSYRYEYALYNFDSENQVGRISIPLGSAAGISNIGFHDPYRDTGGDDWAFNIVGNTLTWNTDDFSVDPDANAIGFGKLFNFRFDGPAPATDGDAVLRGWKNNTSFTVDTWIPESSADAPELLANAGLSLRNSPNPMSRSTNIEFQLDQATSVDLQVFDANGRQIRSLVAGELGAGPHSVSWNGQNAEGSRVASGMYYAKLNAGGQVAVQSLMVLN